MTSRKKSSATRSAADVHNQTAQFLRRIWGTEPGYVWITPQREGEEGVHPSRTGYSWPMPDDELLKLVAKTLRPVDKSGAHFTPEVLKKNTRRKAENASVNRVFGMDLDEVDPRGIVPDLRPDVAWETSPGNWSGAWKFAGDAYAANVPTLLKLALGTDKGGTGLGHTQRLPGSVNVKGKHRRDDGSYPVVTLTEDEDRLWTGEVRGADELKKLIEEHYPGALEEVAASGLAGDRRVSKNDMEVALALSVDEVPLDPKLRSMLDVGADQDPSSRRYAFVSEALERALSLRQIVDLVTGSELASSKNEEQIEEDVARIAGKKSASMTLSSQIKNAVGLRAEAPDEIADPEEAFINLCARLKRRKTSTYVEAYFALHTDAGETWLRRSLPVDFDALETARQVWLPDAIKRIERDQARARAEKKEAKRVASIELLSEEALLLDSEGRGGTFLDRGRLVFARAGEIERVFFHGSIAMAEEVVREIGGRDTIAARMAEVVPMGAQPMRVPLVTEPGEKAYMGKTLAGAEVFMPKPGDRERVIRAARQLGIRNGIYNYLRVPEVYGLHQLAEGAAFFAGARVITSRKTWLTPDDVHDSISLNYTAAEPDPSKAQEFADLVTKAFADVGPRQVAPVLGATFAAPLVHPIGPIFIFGEGSVGKNSLARSFGASVASRTIAYGQEAATVNMKKSTGTTTRALAKILAAQAGLPVLVEEVGNGYPNKIQVASEIVHDTFDTTSRTVLTIHGDATKRNSRPAAAASIVSNFWINSVARSRAVVITITKSLVPALRAGGYELPTTVRMKNAWYAAYLMWIVRLVDQHGGVEQAREEWEDRLQRIAVGLPELHDEQPHDRHALTIAHSAIGLELLTRALQDAGVDPQQCEQILEQGYSALSALYVEQEQDQAEVSTDPVELVGRWCSAALQAGRAHLTNRRDERPENPQGGNAIDESSNFADAIQLALGWVGQRPNGVKLGLVDSVDGLEGDVLLTVPGIEHLTSTFGEDAGHVTTDTLRRTLVDKGLLRVGKDGRARKKVRTSTGHVDVLPIPRQFVFGGDDPEIEEGASEMAPPPADPTQGALALLPPPAVERKQSEGGLFKEPIQTSREESEFKKAVRAVGPATRAALAEDAPDRQREHVAPKSDAAQVKKPTMVILTPDPVYSDGSPADGLSTPGDVPEFVEFVREIASEPGPSFEIVVSVEGAQAIGLPRPARTKAGALRKETFQLRAVNKGLRPLVEAFGSDRDPWYVTTVRGKRAVSVQLAEFLVTDERNALYGDASAEQIKAGAREWFARTGREYAGTPARSARSIAVASGAYNRDGEGLGGQDVDVAWAQDLPMRGVGATLLRPIPNEATRILAVDANAAYLSKMNRIQLPLGNPVEVEDYDEDLHAVWEIEAMPEVDLPLLKYSDASTVVVPDHVVRFVRDELGLSPKVVRGWSFESARSEFRKMGAVLTEARNAWQGSSDEVHQRSLRALKGAYTQFVGGLASAQFEASMAGWYRPHWQSAIVMKAEVDMTRKLRRALEGRDDAHLVGFVTDGALIAYSGQVPELTYGTNPGTLRRESDVEITPDMRAADSLQTLRELVKGAE